jgi:beta-glucanase (GH16 family)
MWERTRYYFTLHTQDSHGNTINTKKTRIEDIEEGYHIYAMDWSKDKIDFFVDNNLVYTFNPENKTEGFGLIINPFYCQFGNWWKFGGPDVDDSIFPQDFSVDYIEYTNK